MKFEAALTFIREGYPVRSDKMMPGDCLVASCGGDLPPIPSNRSGLGISNQAQALIDWDQDRIHIVPHLLMIRGGSEIECKQISDSDLFIDDWGLYINGKTEYFDWSPGSIITDGSHEFKIRFNTGTIIGMQPLDADDDDERGIAIGQYLPLYLSGFKLKAK